MKNFLLFIILAVLQMSGFARGMAVAINNVVLYNQTSKSILVNAPNISKTAQIKLIAHGACLINKPVLFLPNLINNDSNYYIIFSVKSTYNAIMIDNNNELTLASLKDQPNAYSKYGFSQFHLSARCGGKRTTVPIETVVENIPNKPPFLAPKYCTASPTKFKYQFVFSFGNQVYNVPKAIDLKPCVIE